MANEIQFGFRAGATLTYIANQPDGSPRTTSTSLPEASTSHYVASDANILAGDMQIVYEGTNEVGSGTYIPEATVSGGATEAKQDATDVVIDRISAIQEGDNKLDKTTTPWSRKTQAKGTSTVLLKKNLTDIDDVNVTTTEQIIATETDETP